MLLSENKIHAHAADFNDVAVIEARRTGNGRTVHGRSFVAGADVVAIVALADLRGHFGLNQPVKRTVAIEDLPIVVSLFVMTYS